MAGGGDPARDGDSDPEHDPDAEPEAEADEHDAEFVRPSLPPAAVALVPAAAWPTAASAGTAGGWLCGGTRSGEAEAEPDDEQEPEADCSPGAKFDAEATATDP